MSVNVFKTLWDDLVPSIVKIKAYKTKGKLSIGTGFLVHIDGIIVTALHVVRNATKIEVIPENWPHPVIAKLERKNEDDMALLRIDYKGLDENFKARFAPTKVLPRHKHVLSGEEVGLAGYAWGMESKTESVLFVFKRMVSLNIMNPEHSKGLFYYIDGTIIAGMSGGPIFDFEEGAVAGVLTRIEPERYFTFRDDNGEFIIPSPEHLTIALQAQYIHTGLESLGLYL